MTGILYRNDVFDYTRWPMTRRWLNSRPIAVVCDAHHRPSRFTWRGQRHRVVEITKIWRIDFGWWQDRIWRTLYKLRTDTGLLVVLSYDLVTDEWYVESLFD